ncbi:MAG: site-specific DNA-methyltransferase [Candidatus Eisenbacteria bacterium]|uniref:Site-specific DNA-methyltransferase n=1 Tax=Eiseniibacteriota bacterium TaxID=2212470 RepID=A0A948WC87_UNCEI|nr:site-specific DNA-methyltransferase [Candidatus Eisenbacteria bacterium]MBU1950242.1 site-specific DNA-methyltransferase [Candidatus Eisenbacteria bacterium]MBU2690698.1 site-specific DNA-methyltransferase [Candidatus Eisenbacteria bacterium]
MDQKLKIGLRSVAQSPSLQPGKDTVRGLAYHLPAEVLLAALPVGSVDLLYADPPFGTGRQKVSRTGRYDDPGGEAYFRWLEGILQAGHRVLSDKGSLFIHLDWRAAPYARIILDRIFGVSRLVNEIIWAYRTGGVPRRHLARKHDTILYYAKTDGYTFNRSTERSRLRHHYGFSNVKIERDSEGLYRETYLRDVWEIPALRGNQSEASGYPTQKPLALLKRILQIASDPGDLICDPFCGSGTTAVAAESSQRYWITCDISKKALAITGKRLAAESS